MSRALIFTGCGRSGTGYVAQVLSRAGIPTTHEGVFRGYPSPEEQGILYEDTVESSWFAVPFVQQFSPGEVAVVHLVRDPRAWVDSWLRSGVRSSPFVKTFLKRWCPEAMRVDPMHSALLYWVNWNSKVERTALLRLRIEELDQADLAVALQDAGRAVPEAAWPVVPQNFNTKGGEPQRLEWDDFPPGMLIRTVRRMAERYGYR